MARLILKSPYYNGGQAAGYLRYIGTRERVELLPDDRPPTRKQEQLITKLAKDFPNMKSSDAYEDYLSKPTKLNASALISQALEDHWQDVQHSEQYMKYIATRPRADRFGAHGLFGDEDGVDMEAAMAELEAYGGNVWTHIISLKRGDASRLGFDNAATWRDLLRAKRNEIASAMNIPPNNFRWYAAFHDEGEHPHVHMMAWSAKPGQAHLNTEGIRKIKSTLVNQIFENEMLHDYEQKSAARDELVREARQELKRLAHEMQTGLAIHPEAEQLILELSKELASVKGKKSYGYLPKKQKALVDKIVDQMTRLERVAKCYSRWQELQDQIDSYYHERKRQRLPLSQEKAFRAIKNAVLREAEHLRLGTVSFEDRGAREELLELDDLDLSELEARARSAVDYGWAAYRLGRMYARGQSVEQDFKRAAAYFRQAAEDGNPHGQYMLGKLYLMGQGVPNDRERGFYWMSQAAAQGNDYAEFFLARKNENASPSVLLSATRLFQHMGRIFQENIPTPPNAGHRIDRKRWAELQRKRLATGHKANDHEDFGWGCMGM